MAGATGTPVAAQTTTGSTCTVAYPQGTPMRAELDWLPNASVSAASATYDKAVNAFAGDSFYTDQLPPVPLGPGYTGVLLSGVHIESLGRMRYDLVVARHGTDVLTIGVTYPGEAPWGDLATQAKTSIGRLPGQTTPTTTATPTSTTTSTSSPTTSPTSTSASPSTTASSTSSPVTGPPVITDGTPPPGPNSTAWALLGGLSVVLLGAGAVLAAALRRQPQR